jgi:tetratricopeptide (TPR) repeat protein
MPLSRHFYTVDELYAALTYCSRRNDTIETLFWCQELILSGYIGETISTLFEAWLWNKGPFFLSWLHHAFITLRSEELIADDILIAAYQLSAIPYDKQDHSLWNILVLSSEIPDRVTPKTPSWIMKILKDAEEMDEKELYFIRALYQGKAQSAWWMAQQLEEKRVWSILAIYSTQQYSTSYDNIWEALQQYEHLLGYRTAEYDKIILCVAVLSCCLSIEQHEASYKELPIQIPSIQQDALQRWSEKMGQKARRIYSIPTACLYGVTQRGNSPWSHTNVKELNWIEGSLIGCPFWEEAIAEYGTIVEGIIQWHSDDDLEAFYDRYFPDDIPDEWSKAEKAISHGDGVLGPTESVQLYKYSRTVFSKWSRLAWNTRERVLTHLNTYHTKWNGQLSSIVSNIIIKEAIVSPIHRKKYAKK